MPEKEQPFKNQEFMEQTPRPNLLDVVKIDGRWAQVVSTSGFISYLDDESKADINWDDFQRTRDWEEFSVCDVKELTSFTPEELGRIHWGPEQEQHPHLREEVSVFGEFEKKPEKNERKPLPKLKALMEEATAILDDIEDRLRGVSTSATRQEIKSAVEKVLFYRHSATPTEQHAEDRLATLMKLIWEEYLRMEDEVKKPLPEDKWKFNEELNQLRLFRNKELDALYERGQQLWYRVYGSQPYGDEYWKDREDEWGKGKRWGLWVQPSEK